MHVTGNPRPKTIFRNASPERPYTQICNEMLQSYGLSLEATGFLARVMALPPHWNFCKSWAESEFQIGGKRLDRLLKEIAAQGFLKRDQARNADGTHGKVVYSFTDVPWVFGDSDGSSPKNDVAVDDVTKMHRTPLNGRPVERGRRKSGTIKTYNLEKRKREKNVVFSESNSSALTRKYASEPSRVADVQDLVEFIREMVNLDITQSLSDYALTSERELATLRQIFDEHGHTKASETIRRIVSETRSVRYRRKGGIRSWNYFRKAIEDEKSQASKFEWENPDLTY